MSHILYKTITTITHLTKIYVILSLKSIFSGEFASKINQDSMKPRTCLSILSWVSAILFRAVADPWQNNQWSLSDPDFRQLVFQYFSIRFNMRPTLSFVITISLCH